MKLLHKVKWLKKEMLVLQERVGGRCVDLYSDFMECMEAEGLHGLQGDSVDQVNSEEFDFRTDRFVRSPENLRRLKEVFNLFRAENEKSKRGGAPTGRLAAMTSD